MLGYRKGDRSMLEEAEARSLEALGEPSLAGVPAARLECLLERARALRQRGLRDMSNDRLRASVDVCREAMGGPVIYGMRCYNHAVKLRLLGKHEPGTRLLERVVGRNREALACFPREQFPMYWATVKDGLGASLYTLAERQTGTAALATLGEAEQVMLAAIEYRNREASPREWTITQGNIAHVRKAMGERTGEPHFVLDAIDRWGQTLPLLAADGADAEHQEVRGYVKAARAWLATRAAA